MLNHTGGTYFHGGMMDYQRIRISELSHGKYPDSVKFQGLFTNSRSSGHHALDQRS